MKAIPREIQVPQITHFYKADPAYARGVESRLRAIRSRASDDSITGEDQEREEK